MLKNVALSVIPAALVLAFVTFTAEGQTIVTTAVPGVAYVSSQRIVNEVVSARTEFSRLQAMQQQKNNELRGKQQAIDATRQEFATADDAEARTRLLKQEQDQRADLERATQQAQADLQRLQRDVQAEVQARVQGELERIAKAQNLKLVLNADTTIVWSAPGMDITNLLVDRLNTPPAVQKP